MKPPDPIQATLIVARRNQILDAATSVFAEKGFHQATIRDVAKAAGIADGTIYNYFENKTAVLIGILDRLNETSQRANDFAQASQMNMEDWFHAYVKQRLATIEPQASQVFQVLFSEIFVNQELREQYVSQLVQPTFALADQFFRQWIADGTLKDINPALANRIVAGALLGVVILRLIGDDSLQQEWSQLPDAFVEIMLHGLARDEDHAADHE